MSGVPGCAFYIHLDALLASVMAGHPGPRFARPECKLVPAIHALTRCAEDVDARDKRGHDESEAMSFAALNRSYALNSRFRGNERRLWRCLRPRLREDDQTMAQTNDIQTKKNGPDTKSGPRRSEEPHTQYLARTGALP
jgi:hypothetical protein